MFFSKQELTDCGHIIHFLLLINKIPSREIMIWMFGVIPQESRREREKDVITFNKWRDFAQWFTIFPIGDRKDIASFLKREGVALDMHFI